MKILKIAFILLILPVVMSSSLHKFYVSTTQIEYVEEKKSVQIITKIFTEDLEQVLQTRYHPNISLDSDKEGEEDISYLKKYLQQKFKITINGEEANYEYLGKEYDIDIAKIYFEIENVSDLQSIEIENTVLFDIYPEQQNIIHLKISNKKRSFILDKANPKGMLNFD